MAKKSLDSRTTLLIKNPKRSKKSNHKMDNSMVVSKKESGVMTLRRKRAYRADILRRRELKIGGFSRSYIESFNASLAEVASDMSD